jgi:hypothetical protein
MNQLQEETGEQVRLIPDVPMAADSRLRLSGNQRGRREGAITRRAQSHVKHECKQLTGEPWVLLLKKTHYLQNEAT